jgi:hypothetical protein
MTKRIVGVQAGRRPSVLARTLHKTNLTILMYNINTSLPRGREKGVKRFQHSESKSVRKYGLSKEQEKKVYPLQR